MVWIIVLLGTITLFIHLSRQGKVQQLKKRYTQWKAKKKLDKINVELTILEQELEEGYKDLLKDYEQLKKRIKKGTNGNN